MRSNPSLVRPSMGLALPDVALTVACLVVSLVALAVSDEPGARAPDRLAIVLLTATTVPLLWRRHCPVVTTAGIVALTLIYFLFGYPGGASLLPSLIALYTLAAGGHRSWAIAMVVGLAGSGVAYRAIVEKEPPVEIAISSALFVLVLLLGDAVRSRQLLRIEIQRRVRAATEQRDAEISRRIAEERLSIARDVHDVVAHTLAAVGVQAAVAADLLDVDPARARAALTSVRAACRNAAGELRVAVRPMREDVDGGIKTAPPMLASLHDLAARLASDELDIELELEEGIDSLPVEAVQIAAYRIVQEALTNVVRHAGAERAVVEIATRGSRLCVTVEDDGVGPSHDSLDGFGLVGMRERAEAVGGTLDAGLSNSGGFRVEARLPTGGNQ